MTRFGLLPLLVVLLELAFYVTAADFTGDCGQRKLKVTNLIVGGTPTAIANWPWHAAIFHRDGRNFVYQCGGSIINENTILTAAHCVKLDAGIIASERLSVQVGRNRLQGGDERSKEHEADYIIVHERFTTGYVRHDIALIRLATNLELTPYVQPVCLWNQGDDRLLIRDKEGTIVGFGATSTSSYSSILNQATLPVVDNQVCIDSDPTTFGITLTSNMYCAGRRDGINACTGDSGGGMFFEMNGRWYVRGIVSFSAIKDGGGCDPYKYVVFTDVARYIDWIAKKLNATITEAPAASDIHPKLRLLPHSTCGENMYPNIKEEDKPVFLNYPWVGLIEYSKQGSRDKRTPCHAILINDRYLVTAAQCVYNTKDYRPTAIRLGDYDTSTSQDCGQLDSRQTCAPPTQTLNIETITVHQQYNKPRYANDIALIRLRQPADLSQRNVKPVCLPTSKTLRSYKPATFTRVGWKGGASHPLMQRAEVTVIESVQCQRQYSENQIGLEKTFRQICVERDDARSTSGCVFDRPAAPLQAVQSIDGEPRYVLHGLLSFGPNKCHLDYPDVYTNVGTYLKWILDNMQD